jgi:microcin C transport system substrate-binding protein
MPRVRTLSVTFLCAMLLVFPGCAGTETAGDSGEAPAISNPTPANVNKADYPVFSNPDGGADPAVPAEQGGKGFTVAAGWQTNTDFDLIGDPRAVKGGVYREMIADFPSTLRMTGPESNSSTGYMIGNALYETLLMLHPTTLAYVPSLATHWQVGEDGLTFRFRMNPNARFSNGEPVTADDVVASWILITDKELKDPSRNAQFGKYEKPVAESKYVVRVKALRPDWRNLRDFATELLIFPSSGLKGLKAADYLEKFNFAYLPNSGPYAIHDTDIQKGKSISLRRRTDYWAEKDRRNAGLNNFDEIRLTVYLDPTLAFEQFKKGELDFLYINRSSVWFQEMDIDSVKRGLIQKRKVYNNKPAPFQGFAMNTRRPPLDDLRVRKALTLLFDRQKLIEQLYNNEYFPLNTYFPGTVYENPGNAKNLYNPQEAVQLLAEAGWSERDASGRLTKAGKPLVLQMLYDGKNIERVLTVYQGDLQKAGVTLDLKLVPFETRVQMTRRDRAFDMAYIGLGFPLFPDPEAEWHSRLADTRNNNNLTGFKDPRMDELMAKYAGSSDPNERIAALRELDSAMTSQYHYVLAWTAPFLRLAYWNKFGQPAGHLTRTGDWFGDRQLGPGIERLWWIDPAKEGALKKAMADSSVKLGVGPGEDKYWLTYDETP